MANLNAEQIKKALECCASDEYICNQCPIDEKIKDDCECGKVVARNALALIKSQEQRIVELEAKNRQYDDEKRKLVHARDVYEKYAEKMHFLVRSIMYKEADGYEPSDARYAAEMDMWREVATENMKLNNKIEMLHASCAELEQKCASLTSESIEKCASVRGDTVRKMRDRLKQAICDNTYPDFDRNGKAVNIWNAVNGYDLIDQIAYELLEGKDET